MRKLHTWLWGLSLLLMAAKVGAEDTCPCQPDDASCLTAVRTIDKATREGIDTMAELQAASLLLDFVAALRLLEQTEQGDATRRNPRLYSYLANAAFVLSDFVRAERYAQRALEEQRGHTNGPCRLTLKKESHLEGIQRRSSARIVSVRIQPQSELAQLPLKVSARLTNGTAAEESVTYQPPRGPDGAHRLNPGKQRLKVSADGYQTYEKEVEVTPSQGQLDVVLTKEAATATETVPATPAPPSPEVAALLAATRLQVAPVSPTLQIRPANPQPAADASSQGKWRWVAGGLSLAGSIACGVVATDAFLDFDKKNDQLKSMCPGNECSSDSEVRRYHDLREEARDSRRRGGYFAAGGGLLLLASGAFVAWQLSTPRGAAKTARPVTLIVAKPTASGVTLGLGARW